MVVVDIKKNIKTVNREELGDIKSSTEEFVGKHVIDLMFSDDTSKQLYLRVLSTGNTEYNSVNELLENASEDVVLNYTEECRVDHIYKYGEDIRNYTKRFNTKKYYKETYIDYSYLLKLTKANDVDFELSSEDSDGAVFNLSWTDKNKFTDVEMPKIKSLSEVCPL